MIIRVTLLDMDDALSLEKTQYVELHIEIAVCDSTDALLPFQFAGRIIPRLLFQ